MWKVFYPGNWTLTSFNEKHPGYRGDIAQFYPFTFESKHGMMAVKDKTIKQWQDPIRCANGVVLWLAKDFKFEPEKYSSCPTTLSNEVILENKHRLHIHPALVEPQVVVFGGAPAPAFKGYNTRYGKLAWEFRDKISKVKIDGGRFIPDMNSDEFYDLIGLALEDSYQVPIQLWTISGFITTYDLMSIFWKALDAPELPMSKSDEIRIQEDEKKNGTEDANASNLPA